MNARRYPLAHLWNEARYARRRVHGMIRTEAVVMHTVIAQALVGGEALNELLEKFDGA